MQKFSYDLEAYCLLWEKPQNLVADKKEYIVDDKLIIVEFPRKNKLTARDVDKKILWEIETAESSRSEERSGIHTSNNRDYFFARDDLNLSVISIQNGSQIWTHNYLEKVDVIAYCHKSKKLLYQQNNRAYIQEIGCPDTVPVSIEVEEYSCLFSSDGDYLLCLPKKQSSTRDRETLYVKRVNNMLEIFNSNTGDQLQTIDLTMYWPQTPSPDARDI
jgi:hypothetical protein